MKKIVAILLLFFAILPSLRAQDIFGSRGLKDLSPSRLDEGQIRLIRNQVRAAGMTENDLRIYLIGKGMSQTDAGELIRRLGNNQSQGGQQDRPVAASASPEESPLPQQSPLKIDSLMFGAALFANSQINFAPPQNFATPVNYLLGPGDILNLSITGNQEILTDIRIEPSGNLRLPYAGNVMVGGLTIEQAETKIRNALARKGFESLGTGGSRLTLTVSAYRTIPVTIIGARQPGNYNVSSIATAFHLIHLAGGPGQAGTFREIEVIRKGQVVRKIDLYDFLVKGDQGSDIGLEENDLINIPAYQMVVRVSGAVKRPGIFMLKPDETLDDLLRYAGGFAPEAFRSHITVEQIGNNALYSRTIRQEDFNRFKPANGDLYFVGSVAAERYHRVFITGAVKRPGAYGWFDGLRLSELIELGGGPSESLLETRGVIYRSEKNHSNAYLRFIPSEILESKADIILMDGDSVVLSDRKALFPFGFIDVAGEVNKPGRYILGPGMTALDAVLLAGGMKITAISNSIEIVRRQENTGKSTVAAVIKAETDAMLRIRADEVELRHQDVIIIKPDPTLRDQKIVYLRGEVRNPGPYVLLERDEKLSSLLKRAGGLTEFADENAVFILRKNVNPLLRRDFAKLSLSPVAILEMDSLAGQRAINEAMNQNTAVKNLETNTWAWQQQAESPFGTQNNDTPGRATEPHEEIINIALSNINSLIQKPGGRNDLHLQADDEIVVLERDNSVSVRGMVNNQITVNYSGKHLLDYISEAGGVLHQGSKNDIFVLQPNGKAAMTRSYLGIKSYPKIAPGSIIVVPARPQNNRRMDPAAAAALASIITSVSSLLFIIITAAK
ncbi:MAG TPA: SLBB domain-containing protein [Bacteroidales bacterium]|nr:SLBB domain-containing protein [Bacteroidales bacterium]